MNPTQLPEVFGLVFPVSSSGPQENVAFHRPAEATHPQFDISLFNRNQHMGSTAHGSMPAHIITTAQFQ
jgi:hypothetical protein